MPVFTGPLLLTFLSSLWAVASAATQLPFPAPYSSSFFYPEPPIMQAEFTANFMQQKYDTSPVNNIISGFAYFSPSSRKVRVDGAFNGTLQSSFFDFTNVSAKGEVNITLLQFNGGVKQSQESCSSFTQIPGFPLFTPDMLNSTQAVWIGIKHDELYGPVSAWQFLFNPIVIVTAFFDTNNTFVRYDFSVPGQSVKTFTTTRFFNIVAGPVAPSVFESDCT